MHLSRLHIPFFRIFYSTTFTLFTLLLSAALLITPGDQIYQSFRAGELYHIIVVAGVYLITLATAVFIYASRLFATRSALAGIPRDLDLSRNGKGASGTGLGMGRRMGRVVREGLDRSAIISYEGRPRDVRGEGVARLIPWKKRKTGLVDISQRQDSGGGNIEPVWGTISHAWSASPESADLPGLHFEPVIAELGHLVEAKAVSLAPTDPFWEAEVREVGIGEESPAPVPDPLAVDLLQRPIAVGLRSYISHLTNLGMIKPAALGDKFLSMYEKARFSDEELREGEFRKLMAVFADILGNMQPLDPIIVDELRAARDDSQGSEPDITTTFGDVDAQSLASNLTTKHTPRPQAYSSASSTTSSGSDTHNTVRTAPSRPRTSGHASKHSEASQHSPSQSIRRRRHRRDSPISLRKPTSQASIGGRSLASTAGSVIRHSEARTSLDLPYASMNASGEDSPR